MRPSRIRDVQAGATSWTTVDLLDVDSGHGGVLREALETFGVRVNRSPIGQARHLVQALSDRPRAPFLLLACHGDEGSIVIPELAPELEVHQPYRRRVGPDELRSFACFDGATVIATGCDTGHPAMVEAVLDCGAGAYVHPRAGRSATPASSPPSSSSTSSPSSGL